MATLRRRLHRFNGTSYDVVHFETEASLVKMADGTTAEVAISAKAPSSHNHDDLYYREYEVNNLLNGKANSNHNHSAASITSGTLPVFRGGTGVTSIDALKTVLGIGSSDPGGGTTPGSAVSFADYDWIVVHNDGTYKYMMTKYCIGASIFGYNTVYGSSQVLLLCRLFASAIGIVGNSKFGQFTVNGVTGYCNLPSYEQMNGGFSYFNSNSNRIATDTAGNAMWYWTSSPRSGSYVWSVYNGGGLNFYSYSYAFGFRPCVAMKV